MPTLVLLFNLENICSTMIFFLFEITILGNFMCDES